MSKEISIDGVTYVKKSEAGPTPDLLIVVIEGRWNIVGHCTVTDDHMVITEAHVIRYWGTTKGLGELATGGPTSKTILDPTPPIRVPLSKVLLTIDTDAEKWAL